MAKEDQSYRPLHVCSLGQYESRSWLKRPLTSAKDECCRIVPIVGYAEEEGVN